jgi:hypothetical protein
MAMCTKSSHSCTHTHIIVWEARKDAKRKFFLFVLWLDGVFLSDGELYTVQSI